MMLPTHSGDFAPGQRPACGACQCDSCKSLPAATYTYMLRHTQKHTHTHRNTHTETHTYREKHTHTCTACPCASGHHFSWRVNKLTGLVGCVPSTAPLYLTLPLSHPSPLYLSPPLSCLTPPLSHPSSASPLSCSLSVSHLPICLTSHLTSPDHPPV